MVFKFGNKQVALLAAGLLAALLGAPGAAAWTWPVDGPVLRPFVADDDPYTGGQHRGIDIGAPSGTDVLAPASGVVSFAGQVPRQGLGRRSPKGRSWARSARAATPKGPNRTSTSASG